MFDRYPTLKSLPTGAERTATVARARTEAERAEKLGDDSNLLKMMLDRVRNPRSLENQNEARMQAAEALFAKGDLDGALAAYRAIIAADPKSYAAYVYAGDVYFRKRNYKDAGEWFAKAIEVDPNRETAYRYWGDALCASRSATQLHVEVRRETQLDYALTSPLSLRHSPTIGVAAA